MPGLLDAMTPIVRGECDACGSCRNLWVSEMAGDGPVPCGCAERAGCKGTYSVAFAGPKKFMPEKLANVTCRCAIGNPASAPPPVVVAPSEPEPEQEPLVHGHSNNGLEEEEAMRQALALSMGGAGEPQPEPEAEADGAPDSARDLTEEEKELAAKYLSPPADEEVAECSICFDELRLASAAMRCAGGAGRAHYFHAGCLSDWAAQCRAQGNAPSCPECRGPVQVRRQRLCEFLQVRRIPIVLSLYLSNV